MRTASAPWRAKASARSFSDVTGMTFHPIPDNVVGCCQIVEHPPEIVIRPIAAALHPKISCFPAFKPLRHSLLHVLTIRVDGHAAGLLEGS